jgi:hypothetical protein
MMSAHSLPYPLEQRPNYVILEARGKIEDYLRRIPFGRRFDVPLSHKAQNRGLQAAKAEVETGRIHARQRKNELRPRRSPGRLSMIGPPDNQGPELGDLSWPHRRHRREAAEHRILPFLAIR